MLTRSKSQLGEGELVEGDPETGSRKTFPKAMSSPRGEEGHEEREKSVLTETEFLEAFISMKNMVEMLFEERAEKKKREDETLSKDAELKSEEKGKGIGDGDLIDANKSSSSHTSHLNNANMPYFKLDVKFELPIYNGDLDAEKLDNWIKQLEVYCRVQGINDDPSRIQLATLRMSGMALTWWESKVQQDLQKNGKIISVWTDFIKVLRKQFYPLGHIQ
jgi:hypothetical protein